MLTDLGLLADESVTVITFAAVDRAAHACDPVPRDHHAHRIIGILFEIAPGNDGFAAGSVLVGEAVADLDVAELLISDQLPRFVIRVGIDLQIAGKALGHVVAVGASLPSIVEGCDQHMARPGAECLPVAAQTGDLSRHDLVERSGHVLAAIALLRIGAVTAHLGDLVSLDPHLHLVLLGALDGRVILFSVLDQGAYLILFVILPSPLQNRGGEKVLPLEHVTAPPAFRLEGEERWPGG